MPYLETVQVVNRVFGGFLNKHLDSKSFFFLCLSDEIRFVDLAIFETLQPFIAKPLMAQK